MGDYIRDFSEFQFHQSHSLPRDRAFQERKDTAVSSLSGVMVCVCVCQYMNYESL